MLMVIDGNGNSIDKVKYTDYGEFLTTFLKDDRAKYEMRDAVKRLLGLEDLVESSDESSEIVNEVENILLCLEAVFEYESGAFKGSDYFHEAYWNNWKRFYANLGNRQ